MPTNTRVRLLETAGDLFYRHGFQAVGLDQVLTEVGITKTAFYKHFESKDDLIVAVLDQRDRADVAEAIAEMRKRGGDDPKARVLAFFDLLGEWFAQPEFRGCLFMNAATEFPWPNHPIHQAAAAHARNLSAEIAKPLTEAGLAEPSRLATQVMLLVSGAIAARHTAGQNDAAAAARTAAEMLLNNHLPKARKTSKRGVPARR